MWVGLACWASKWTKPGGKKAAASVQLRAGGWAAQVVVEPTELDAARTAQGDTGYIETSRDPANYVDSFAPGDEEGCVLSTALAALHAKQ